MKKNTDVKAKELRGLFLYQLKNQTIFYDPIFRKAYVLTNDKVNKHSMFQMRIPFAIIAGCVSYLVYNNEKVAFGLGIGLILVLGVWFRIFLNKNLPVVTNFKKPPRDGIISDVAKSFTMKRLWIIFILSIILVGSLIFNITMLDLDKLNKTIYAVMAVFGFLIALVVLASIIHKSRNN